MWSLSNPSHVLPKKNTRNGMAGPRASFAEHTEKEHAHLTYPYISFCVNGPVPWPPWPLFRASSNISNQKRCVLSEHMRCLKQRWNQYIDDCLVPEKKNSMTRPTAELRRSLLLAGHPRVWTARGVPVPSRRSRGVRTAATVSSSRRRQCTWEIR